MRPRNICTLRTGSVLTWVLSTQWWDRPTVLKTLYWRPATIRVSRVSCSRLGFIGFPHPCRHPEVCPTLIKFFVDFRCDYRVPSMAVGRHVARVRFRRARSAVTCHVSGLSHSLRSLRHELLKLQLYDKWFGRTEFKTLCSNRVQMHFFKLVGIADRVQLLPLVYLVSYYE